MTETLRLAAAILAVYRIAQLITLDDGPGDVFLRLRDAVGCSEYGEDGRCKRGIARLLSCPYCIGVWAAAVAAALWLWPTRIGDALLVWLAIAGGQAYLECRNGQIR